jgi:cation-transporting ATPase I
VLVHLAFVLNPSHDDVAAYEIDVGGTHNVLEAAAEAGEVHRTGWQFRAELPFEPARGYSAALGETEDGPALVVKGAPEAVLPRCSPAPEVEGMVDRLAADGLRVLAVAERRGGLPGEATELEPLVDELTFVGFVGIADTPRADAAAAVEAIGAAGADVVMLTGDHPVTARAVARSTGIADGNAITGADLRRMSESERVSRVAGCTVFARVTPEDKAQIVKALQAGGHVVAMIGDGINDAAAIRRSDVGIGINTERSTSARSAADLVLTKPDLGHVSQALLEGRALWRRVRDAVSILVGGNAGEVMFMVIGTALGGRAPMTTRQMLLVNMLTDMFPALAVALAPSRNGDEPNGPVGALLSKPLARAVAVRGAGTTLGATLAWAAGRMTGRRRRASTMGLAALVTTQLGQTLLTGRHSRLVVATSVGSFLALVLAVQTPGLSHFLGCCPLGPVAWGIVLASAAAGTFAAAVASARASDQEAGSANQASTPASN